MRKTFQEKRRLHSAEQRSGGTENEDVPHWVKTFSGTLYRDFTVKWNEMKIRWHQNAPFPQTTSWNRDSFMEESKTTSDSTSFDLRSSKKERLFHRRRAIAILVITLAILLTLAACIVSAVLIEVVLVTPPKDAPVEARLKAHITNKNYTEELSNKTSAEFQQFQTDFCFQVQRKINEDSYCLVTDLKSGSIIVEFIIVAVSWNGESSYGMHIKNNVIGTVVDVFNLTEIDVLYSRVIVIETISNDAIFYIKEQSSSTSTHPSQTSIFTGQPDPETVVSSITYPAYSSGHSVSNGQITSSLYSTVSNSKQSVLENSSNFQSTYSGVSSQLKYSKSQIAVSSHFEELIDSINTTPATLHSTQSFTDSSEKQSTYKWAVPTTALSSESTSSMQRTNTVSRNFVMETMGTESGDSDARSKENLDKTSTKYYEAISPTSTASNIPDASSSLSLVTSDQKVTEESKSSTFPTGINFKSDYASKSTDAMSSMFFTSSTDTLRPSSDFVVTSHLQDTQKQTVSLSDVSTQFYESTFFDFPIRPSTTESKVLGQSSSNFRQDESTSESSYSLAGSQTSFQSEDQLSSSSLISRGSHQETAPKSNSKAVYYSTTNFLGIQASSLSRSTYSLGSHQRSPESPVTQMTSVDVGTLQSSYIDSTYKLQNMNYSLTEQSDTSLSVSQSWYLDATYSLMTTAYGLTDKFDSGSVNHDMDETSVLMTSASSSSLSFVIDNDQNIQSSPTSTEYDTKDLSSSESYTGTSFYQLGHTSNILRSSAESLYTIPLQIDQTGSSMSGMSDLPSKKVTTTRPHKTSIFTDVFTTNYEATTHNFLMLSSKVVEVSTDMETTLSITEFFEESNYKTVYSASAMTQSGDIVASTSTDIFSRESMSINPSSFRVTSTAGMSTLAEERSIFTILDNMVSSSVSASDRSVNILISPSGSDIDTNSLGVNSISTQIDAASSQVSLIGVTPSGTSEMQSPTPSLIGNDISYSSEKMDIGSSFTNVYSKMLSSDLSATDTLTLLLGTYSDGLGIDSASYSDSNSSILLPSSMEKFIMSTSDYMITETPDVGVQNVVIYQNESLSITCNVTNAENFTLISINVNDEEIGRISTSNSTIKSPWILAHESSSDYQVYHLKVLDTNCTTTGYYSCSATGDWGVVQQKASIEVRVRPGNPKVTFPDELVQNRRIKQDIQCEVDAGVPSANVTWSVRFNNGTTIQEYDFSPTSTLNNSASCSSKYSSSFSRSFDLDWHNSSLCCNVNQFGLKTSTCEALFLLPENFCIVNNGSNYGHPYDDCYLFISCGSGTTYVSTCKNSGFCYDVESSSCSREPDRDPNQDVDPYSCDGKANYAYIPVRDSCTEYIRCVNGQRFNYTCATGTYFISTNELCRFNEEEAFCKKSTT